MQTARWPVALVMFVVLAVAAGLLVAVAVTPAVALTGQGVAGAASFFESLPSYLQIDTPQQVSTVYATKGGQQVPIATFYAEDRVDVDAAAIADTVKQAAVDTEDPRFYTEGGVDVLGTIRGVAATALGTSLQGGSSITQQYVKNVLVQECEQLATTAAVDACYKKATAVTPERKLQEIRYAVSVDKKYTKQQVLTGYLNIVGLGGQVYGVQAGARYYFGVDAKDLSLVQAATLVAILNNPANLRIDQPASTTNGAANGYALTKARRDYVLDRMAVHGDITTAARDAAIATPVTPAITQTTSGCAAAAQYDAAYYCDYVKHELENDSTFGKTVQDRIAEIDTAGLKIYTPLNLDLQATAQRSLSTYAPATLSGVDLGATNVSVEPGTGRLMSMVQNTAYSNTSSAGATSVNYNADEAYGASTGFPTGSTFKAFTLAEWLMTGHTLTQDVSTTQHSFPFSEFTNSCEQLDDSKVWNVANAETAASPLSVLQATAQSVNTAFAQMGRSLDLCKIADVASSMGVHVAKTGGKLVQYPSMILGTNSLSPIDLASAYAGFSDGGVVCTPVAIDKVVDATGSTVRTTPTSCTQGVPADIAAAVDYALQTVLRAGGTGATANPGDGVPIMAKTGTTDGDSQNWLIASTTSMTNATWVGNASGNLKLATRSLLGGTTGYSAKFAIAKPILQAMDATYGGSAFPTPSAELVGGSASANSVPSASVTPDPAGSAPATPGAAGSASGASSTGGSSSTGVPAPAATPAG